MQGEIQEWLDLRLEEKVHVAKVFRVKLLSKRDKMLHKPGAKVDQGDTVAQW